MTPGPRRLAVLAGAGDGTRLGRPEGKAMVSLAGRPLFLHALRTLAAVDGVRAIAVVLRSDQLEAAREAVARWLSWDLKNRDGPDIVFVQGGRDRQESVSQGLQALAEVLGPEAMQGGCVAAVHDAGRPLASRGLFERVFDAADEAHAAGPAVAVHDSLCRAGRQEPQPVARTGLVRLQTPQAWAFRRLLAAHSELAGRRPGYTDDLSLARESGAKIRLVAGEEQNVKVTTPEDLELAERLLTACRPPRTGIGFDVHPLAPGNGVRVGGVTVPCEMRLLGHSDGDPAAHAAIDALLGAAGMGDIGELFPPGDPRWAGLDSMKLLSRAWRDVAGRGFALVNLDVSILAEFPKLSPHYPAMRAALASALGCAQSLVNVKATTCEKLGFVGRGEGVAALATAVVVQVGDRR